jgi:hypothetical protein
MSLAILAPVPLNWLAAILILILAARPDSLQKSIRKVLTSWLGILGLFAVGLATFVQEPIVGTAVFILLFALLAEEHKRTKREHFESMIVDEVTTSNRWFSEVAFDERPKKQVDKTVTTLAPSV